MTSRIFGSLFGLDAPQPVAQLVISCPRRSNFDPPCRLNFDPGLVAEIA
jgi:hypothetical protein